MSQHCPPLAHASLRLEDIDPGKAISFSPNLYAYLRARGHFYGEGGTPEGVYVVQSGAMPADAYKPGSLMIGFPSGEDFYGTPLMAALGRGAKAERMAYPIGKQVHLLRGFWDRYLKVGRCAMDPLHIEPFFENRFGEAKGIRTCLWCGKKKQNVLHSSTDHDVSWENP